MAGDLRLPMLAGKTPGAGLSAGCLLAELPEQQVTLSCTTFWSSACQLCPGLETVARRFVQVQVLEQTPIG